MTLIEVVKRNWGIITFGILGPVLGFAVTFAYFNFASPLDKAAGYALGMGVAVLFHVGFTTLFLTQKSDEVTTRIDSASEEFKAFHADSLAERFRIIMLTPKEANESISAVIRQSDSIKNTYVKISDNSGVNTAIGQDVIKLYCEFLTENHENNWTDITTYGDLSDGRFSNICPEQEVKGVHSVYVTDGYTEIINFLIAEKNGVSTDVFFGWVSNASDNYQIFHTKEKSIIDLYEGHFALLKSRAIDNFVIDYSEKTPLIPSKANNLLGRWVTVSMVKNNVECSADIRRYSVMDVQIRNGAWWCNVTVFERAPFKKVSVITTRHVQAFERAIFYEFKRVDILDNLEEEGFGSYRLTRVSNDIIAGVYVIPNKNKLMQTFAIRVADEDINSVVLEGGGASNYIEKLFETEELALKSSSRKNTEAVQKNSGRKPQTNAN